MPKKVVTAPELPQLWVVERTDDRTKRVYVYADRWFDVRECGGIKLDVRGDYNLLFISAVMGEVKFRKTPVFHVQYSGYAPHLERRFVDITKEPWLKN